MKKVLTHPILIRHLIRGAVLTIVMIALKDQLPKEAIQGISGFYIGITAFAIHKVKRLVNRD